MAAPMYPYSHLPSPLPTQALYALLALSRTPLHAYAVKSAIQNDSLGSIKLATGRVYTLIDHLQNEAFIEPLGPKPVGKSRKERMHYTISAHGTLRLKEELTCLNHLIKIAKATGLMEPDEIPVDIQRALLNANLTQ